MFRRVLEESLRSSEISSLKSDDLRAPKQLFDGLLGYRKHVPRELATRQKMDLVNDPINLEMVFLTR